MQPDPPDARPRALRLGHLELAVLDHLWEAGAVGVTAVHAAVGAPRDLSRNTVHSTLEPLVRRRRRAQEEGR